VTVQVEYRDSRVDKACNKVITLSWNLVLDSSSIDDGTAIVQKVSEEDTF
jgi:hypothetical protein